MSRTGPAYVESESELYADLDRKQANGDISERTAEAFAELYDFAKVVGDTGSGTKEIDAYRSYECLFCGRTLAYTSDPKTASFDYFVHESDHADCCNDGNVSAWHRLGQEVVAKELFNWIPALDGAIQIDIERRIGTPSEFVIADIRVASPVRLAVEIVYLNPELDLQRRLQTLFEQGYAGMFVVLTNGTLTAARVERLLTPVGTIRIGRFDPHTRRLRLGSVVTPTQVDLDTPRWSAVPAYLC